MKLEIWTDGSSRGNPGRGGWGTIIIAKNDGLGMKDEGEMQNSECEVIELGGRDDMTTNNRMELMAAIRGLQEVKSEKSKVESIEINTDSQYVKKGMTEWIDGWIARGWKGSNKKPVLNQDLWQELKREEDRLKNAGIKITWRYVKAHCGIPLNERADTIATEFADANDLHLYRGLRSGYRF